MEVPHCYEAEMTRSSEPPANWEVMNPYAFANVIVSRGGGDVAVFLQLPTDNNRKLSSGITRVFAMDHAGASLLDIQPRCCLPVILQNNTRCFHPHLFLANGPIFSDGDVPLSQRVGQLCEGNV